MDFRRCERSGHRRIFSVCYLFRAGGGNDVFYPVFVSVNFRQPIFWLYSRRAFAALEFTALRFRHPTADIFYSGVASVRRYCADALGF